MLTLKGFLKSITGLGAGIGMLLVTPNALLAFTITKGKGPAGVEINPRSIRQATDAEFAAARTRAIRPPLPLDRSEYEREKRKANREAFIPAAGAAEDRFAVQDTAQEPAVNAAAAPTTYYQSRVFDGPSMNGWVPADPIMAAGPNDVVVMVNDAIAIYSKTGTNRYQTTLENWWADVITLPNACDPQVVYDCHAGRWIMLALAFNSAGTQSSILLSVSKTSDPMGDWWNYNLSEPSGFADYPKLGFDCYGAIYIATNQFSYTTGNFINTQLRVLKKSQAYKGLALTWTDFTAMRNADNSLVFTLQPAHMLSPDRVEYLVNNTGGPGNYVTLWKVTSSTGTPALTRVGTISVRSYSIPPNAAQPGGSALIDTNDTRLLNAVYTNYNLYTSFAEAKNWGSGTVSANRYVAINTRNNILTADIAYGSDGYYYFFPVICPDSAGNVFTLFNRSSTTEYAGARYTMYNAGTGILEGSTSLAAGQGYYTQERWGDYNGIARDPVKGTSIWIFSMYATNSNSWATKIAEVSSDDF